MTPETLTPTTRSPACNCESAELLFDLARLFSFVRSCTNWLKTANKYLESVSVDAGYGNPRTGLLRTLCQGCQNSAFGKRSFCRGDTCHFRHFRRFPGLEEQNPFFSWVECNIRIFANFRQNHLFSAGGKTTVFQNDRFDNPDWANQTGFLEARLGFCVFRVPQLPYKKRESVHLVHGDPPTGPFYETSAKQHGVLRSLFQGLCVQGAQNCASEYEMAMSGLFVNFSDVFLPLQSYFLQ